MKVSINRAFLASIKLFWVAIIIYAVIGEFIPYDYKAQFINSIENNDRILMIVSNIAIHLVLFIISIVFWLFIGGKINNYIKENFTENIFSHFPKPIFFKKYIFISLISLPLFIGVIAVTASWVLISYTTHISFDFLVSSSNPSFLYSLLIVIYFIPSIISYKRKHHNKLSIVILNTILGWTILGWVISLVWSVTMIYHNGDKPSKT